MTFPVSGGVPHHRARIEAVFESPRMLDGWTCQLLDTHMAGLILEIERAQGRSLVGRNRVDGAAPLMFEPRDPGRARFGHAPATSLSPQRRAASL